MLQKKMEGSSMRKDDQCRQEQQEYVLQKCPTHVTPHSSNIGGGGGQHKGSTHPHDAAGAMNKVNPSGSNNRVVGIFSRISDFVAQLGSSSSSTLDKDRDSTHAVNTTPSTTAGSALCWEEAPTEIYDDEQAPLDSQWGSDSEVVTTLPLSGCEEHGRPSPPIDVAGKGSRRRDASSPGGGDGGCQGRRAGELGGVEGGEEGGDDADDARAKIKAWKELCGSKRISFTVRKNKGGTSSTARDSQQYNEDRYLVHQLPCTFNQSSSF